MPKRLGRSEQTSHEGAPRIRELKVFEAFHRLVPSFVERMNEDPGLALRALANPLLAIEELGIGLVPAVRREVEHRIRFSEEQRKALQQLRAELAAYAGDDFEPDSEAALEQLLFTHLGLPRPEGLELAAPAPERRWYTRAPLAIAASVRGPSRREPTWTQRPAAGRGTTTGSAVRDPLERLRGAHPVVELLLEHRAITASVPALASRAAYESLKRASDRLPIASVQVRLPEHVEPEAGDRDA